MSLSPVPAITCHHNRSAVRYGAFCARRSTFRGTIPVAYHFKIAHSSASSGVADALMGTALVIVSDFSEIRVPSPRGSSPTGDDALIEKFSYVLHQYFYAFLSESMRLQHRLLLETRVNAAGLLIIRNRIQCLNDNLNTVLVHFDDWAHALEDHLILHIIRCLAEAIEMTVGN